MSIYKELLKEFYEDSKEWLNSTGSYQEKAVKAYEEILENLSKKGFPKKDVKALCDAQDVSRIFSEVDELAEAGYKIDKQSVALFKLYNKVCEKVSGKGTDISKLSTSEINKLTKCSKALSKVGGIALVLDTLGTVVESVRLINEEKEDEAGAKLREYGCGLLVGAAFGALADVVVASLVISNPIVAVAIMTAFALIGTGIGEGISNWLDEIFGLYDEAGAYTYPVDPLIFDLDGDGIETVSVKNGVNFDFDNNGFAEKIGWVSADDGLLVRDLNNNGNIDNGNELFGDMTAIADGIHAVNGFEALAVFDLNEDGVINGNDAIYSELKIWQDKNQNGVVDEGELLSLQEVGIADIGLNYDMMNETDESGNIHTQKGTYTKTDGTTAVVEDVWFAKDVA